MTPRPGLRMTSQHKVAILVAGLGGLGLAARLRPGTVNVISGAGGGLSAIGNQFGARIVRASMADRSMGNCFSTPNG